jgi:AcrR family transcriptional regulator
MNTERQIQIVEKSMELIATKGIQGFTIKNLSKAIGISEPAIYRHFENKTAILLNILDTFKDMGEIMNMIVESEDTAVEKIEFMFSKMLDIFSEQPAIVSVIFSEEIFKNEIVLKKSIISVHNMHQENVEKIIVRGQKMGNVRNDIDDHSLALIIMGSLRLLVKRWELNNHNFDLAKEGKKLINSFELILK